MTPDPSLPWLGVLRIRIRLPTSTKAAAVRGVWVESIPVEDMGWNRVGQSNSFVTAFRNILNIDRHLLGRRMIEEYERFYPSGRMGPAFVLSELY